MEFKREYGMDLIKTARFSDFTVVCGEHEFKVHKIVLHSISPFFARCIEGGFKESDEAKVCLDEWKPMAVATTLAYAYVKNIASPVLVKEVWPSLPLSPEEAKKWKDCGPRSLHMLDMYKLATFLDYNQLRGAAKSSILAAQRELWQKLADHKKKYPKVDGVPKERAIMANLLSEIYTRVSEEEGGLRAAITAECAKNYKLVRHFEDIQKVVDEYEAFAFKVGVEAFVRAKRPAL